MMIVLLEMDESKCLYALVYIGPAQIVLYLSRFLLAIGSRDDHFWDS